MPLAIKPTSPNTWALSGAPARPATRRSGLVWAGILCAAAFSGLLIGLGGPKLGAALVLGCLLGASFLIPLPQSFWALVVITFILTGPVQYFGGIGRIFWLPYLIGAILLLRATASAMFAARGERAGQGWSAPHEIALILIVVILFISTLANWSPVLQVLFSAKEYFFLWGTWFLIVGGVIAVRSIDRIWAWLPWFLLLQLPVVIYQRFFISSTRKGASPWDAVVGLFGGNPEGGGASGAMAMITVIAVAMAIIHWRRGLMSGWKLALTAALGLATLMLSEVKFAIVLIPIVVALIFGRELLSRPLRSLAMLSVAVTASLAIGYAYLSQYASSLGVSNHSIERYVETAVRRNSDTDMFDPFSREMGRIAAVKFWWKEQSLDDPLHIAIGNGIGASRLGLVQGEVAKRYIFVIERSSVTILLWEAGILGLLAVIGALSTAVLTAFRLARRTTDAGESAVLQTMGVGLFVTLLNLPYGPDFIRVPQFQLFAILMLARVLVAARTHAVTARLAPARVSNTVMAITGAR